ncbi:hypothetical protein [Guggenheimella bovis]
MKLWIWCELSLKRAFKKKGFIALLVALPLLSALIFYWSSHHTTGVEVGVLRSEEEAFKEVSERILKNEGMYHFVLYDEREVLEEDVANRKLEAGVVFDASEGSLGTKVTMLMSPSSVSQGIIAEIIFSELLDVKTEDVLRDLVKETKLFDFDLKKAQEDVLKYYSKHQANGGPFHFSYEYLDGTNADEAGFTLFQSEGLIAIFVLLGAWIHVLEWYKDESNRLYLAFSTKRQAIAGFLSVLVPTLLITISGILVLIITEGSQGIFKGIGLILYTLSVCSLLFGAKAFFRSPLRYASLIPVVLLGSIITSPMIVNVGKYIPGIHILEKFFLPSYYLNMYSGKLLWGALGLVMFMLFGAFLWYFFVPKTDRMLR